MQSGGCGAWIFFAIMVSVCVVCTVAAMRFNLIPWDQSYEREVKTQYMFGCLVVVGGDDRLDLTEQLLFCECQYETLRDLHTIRRIDRQLSRFEVLDADFERDMRQAIDFCYAEMMDR